MVAEDGTLSVAVTGAAPTPEQQRLLWEQRDSDPLPDDVTTLLSDNGFKADWEPAGADGHIAYVIPEWLREGLEDELWHRPFDA